MTGTMEQPEISCGKCGQEPAQNSLIASLATEEGITPDEYIWQEEGTLNRETGKYACDSCYIAMGMPTTPQGWTFPEQ